MSSASSDLVVVLDTNLIVSGVLQPQGLPNRVLNSWLDHAFVVISSPSLAAETTDVLSRPSLRDRFKLNTAFVGRILAAIADALVQPIPLDMLPVRCRDPKDDPVLACALGGNADFIVSGDADLLELDRHPALGKLRIVTPRAFLELLSDEPDSAQ